MNSNTIKGDWNDIKGKIKSRFAKFTDNDIDGLKGDLQSLAGKIQSVYGYAKEKAESEYNDFRRGLDPVSGQSDKPEKKYK